MDASHSLVLGVLAGLALAVPLGAIGVLLVQEGVTRGLRRGLPAAAAAATVDTSYCTAALAAGALVAPTISGWAPWPQVVGGAALVALGAYGLRRAPRRTAGNPMDDDAVTGSGWTRYGLFAGLTAINPATLLYFAAIVPGLDQAASSTGAQILLVIGVGSASLAWQALLVALGAGLRLKAGAAFHRWTPIVGNGMVTLLGVLLIARAVL